jgi:hypothetical protein
MTKRALRLSAGRTALWRHPGSLQLGLDPRYALVLDGLNPALADAVQRIDGRVSADELAGRDDATLRQLHELEAAGLLEPVGHDGPPALLPDVAAWTLRTGGAASSLVARRAAATVEVCGGGRIALGVATLLAAAGVGTVTVLATGIVTSADVGTGYLPCDVGQVRRTAAAAAVRRSRTMEPPSPAGAEPDLVVLTDSAVWDPCLSLRLVGGRVPHLAVHGTETSAVVGPLVLPGRTGCLRCADLHRAARDPCWPVLAAQLATRSPPVELACAQVAAGMAAEQVLALLTGPGFGPNAPPTLGCTLELDPLHGEVLRRRWPPHHACDCGAPVQS